MDRKMARMTSLLIIFTCCWVQLQAIEFPWSKFFNQTLSQDLEYKINEKFSCSRYHYRRSCCSCDDDCMKRKSCCIDKFWNGKTSDDLTKYLTAFIIQSKAYQELTCEDILPQKSVSSDKTKSYLMVSTCKESANRTDMINCKNRIKNSFDITMPVVGSDSKMYRNLYCAKCNDVESFNFVEIKAECNGKGRKGRDIFEEFFWCKFDIAERTVLSCSPYIFLKSSRSCDKDNQYYDTCKSYMGVYAGYANFHCFLCNNPNADIDKYSHSIISEQCYQGEGVGNHGWTLIFSYDGHLSISNKRLGINEKRIVCKKHEKYDFTLKRCTQFSCSHGFHVNGTKCVRDITLEVKKEVTDNSYNDSCLYSRRPNLYLKLAKNVNETDLLSFLQRQLNISKESFRLLYVDGGLLMRQKSFKEINLLKRHFEDPRSTLWNFTDTVYLTSQQQILSEHYGFDAGRTFLNHKLCAIPKIFDAKTVNFSSDCQTFIADSNISIAWSNASMWVTSDKEGHNSSYSICTLFHLQSNCTLSVVTDNYTIVENATLIVNLNTSVEHKYKADQYVPLEKGFGICYEPPDKTAIQSKTTSWLSTVNDIDYYISVVGAAISIVFLLWIIITYLYFKELHSTPAFNTVALCFSLLLSDVAFIVGVENKDTKVCKAFAIILHWSLLTVVMWTVVIAFDIMWKFTHLIRFQKIHRKQFIAYCCLAYSVPAVIVLVAVMIDEHTKMEIGYGKNQICWIVNFHGRLITFIVPTALGYVSTAVLLCLTLLKIRKDNNENSSALQNSGREKVNMMKITLKLTCVLGVVEGIGFIQISGSQLTENEMIFNSVFGLLASTSRGLRGFFLWLIYTCKKEVFDIYRNGFKKINHKQKTQDTGLTNSTSL